MKPQAIHGKKDTRFAQALDSQQNSIQVKDTVKVVDGPFAVGLFSIPTVYSFCSLDEHFSIFFN